MDKHHMSLKGRIALSKDSFLGYGLKEEMVTTLQLELKGTTSIYTGHVQVHSYRH